MNFSHDQKLVEIANKIEAKASDCRLLMVSRLYASDDLPGSG